MLEQRFLVVEDEPSVARAIERELRPFGEIIHAADAGRAREILDRASVWCGCVVDLHLGEGDARGHDVVRWIRQLNEAVPVLILTGDVDTRWVNVAFALDASLLHKPFDRDGLRPFVRRALLSATDESGRLVQQLALLVRKHGLSRRDEAIIVLALKGFSRQAIAETQCVNESTLKDHIKSLLNKTAAKDLSELCGDLFRAALRVG